MTKKRIEAAINEARIWGKCFLGNVCFDTVKDSKKVNNYLRKNNIEDVYLYYCEDGWFMISIKGGGKKMEELFEQIRRYGTFLAEFGCTNDLGMAIRVRVAELDGKKYFIVQCNGNISKLLEI